MDNTVSTAGKGSLSKKGIMKFNTQYQMQPVKTNTDFHDRFLIIDKAEIYHIGASIKDAGKKLWNYEDRRQGFNYKSCK